MRIALQSGESDEYTTFMRQLGLADVVAGPPPSDTGVIELDGLERRREYFESRGLRWDVIENLPNLDYHEIMFGLEGRDRQVDNVCHSIENVGRAGIGTLQYGWMLVGGIRTEYSPTGRGGARYPRFDQAVADRAPVAAMDWLGPGRSVYPHVPDRDLSADEVWDNLTWFLERIVPVAESAGVRLALHPEDPPIPSYLGVARIIINWQAMQRLVDTVPSPSNGIGFCMGTVATMADVDVVAAIRHFGGLDRIFFAHFRNPRGRVPSFDEVFPDEGDIDMPEAVRAWRDVGYTGVIRIDHCPGVVGDTRAERSFAYQVGYLKGLVQALSAEDAGEEDER